MIDDENNITENNITHILINARQTRKVISFNSLRPSDAYMRQ